MHREILTGKQAKLLSVLSDFKKNYFLVGGTAIAIQIGHRRSIDFDLFTLKKVDSIQIRKVFKKYDYGIQVRHQAYDQFHIEVEGVKITFFEFPYKIEADIWYENYFRMPELLDLAAMKCLALGGRAKWKDYVDIYYLLKNHFSLTQISNRAVELFMNEFNPKLLRQQLSYFKDIDYGENVIFLPGFEKSKEEIQSFLTEVSLESF